MVLSPTAPASVPQDHLEPVLLDHLRSFGTAQLQLGTEVVGLDSRSDGAHVMLRDVATGETRFVHACYLVAADGARSTVRDALAIGMRGPGRLSRAIETEFRAPLWDLLAGRRYCIYAVTHPDAAGVFVPAGRGDRWVYGVEQELDEQGPASLTEEQAAASSDSVAGWLIYSRGSSESGPSPSPRSSRTASGAVPRSSSVTPHTRSPHAGAPA